MRLVEPVLLVVNARAGSVSPRRKEVIVKALAADFKLEVADTLRRGHATELARDAAERGFRAVLAFGGDGTINEVAQPLVHTDVSLGILPGGSTNVMARSLGVPADPVEATAYVSSRMRTGTRRRINVGRINERYFLFSAGIGLDGEVVKRVEADPDAKRKSGEWLWLKEALASAWTGYRGVDPALTVTVDGDDARKVSFLICANSRPLTYFKRWPVDACPQAHLDEGLDFLGLTHVRAWDIPRIAWGVLVSRAHVRWKSTYYVHDAVSARAETDRPLPAQVDGDYIGDMESATLELQRDALNLLA